MSSFTKDLIVRIEQGEWHGRGTFTVVEEFSYDIGHLGSGNTITIPKGFVSDGLSIPWYGRAFMPTLGKGAKAGVLHDYLLWKGYDKIEAAIIFREALAVLGVTNPRRALMYWSVKFWPWADDVTQP
jgi:hypothetical protein